MGAARQQDRHLVHQPRDAVGRHPRHAVRVSRLSHCPPHHRDAAQPLDVALRFRRPGRDAPQLARRARCEPPAPVNYFTAEEGGVSHSHYWRDNVLLTSTYLRLVAGFLINLPWLIARRLA